MGDNYICIHGHFYQPPRENPWLEEVEFQESALPYHDWNERITAECYAPNAVSRIMDPQWRIIGLINNYSKISFNFGPTLLSWLQKHNQTVYQAILTADKESMKNFSGHGSAMAQVYSHMIMPLANRRDKITQVKWAIGDFVERFGRHPEGMWLAETAVDIETLEILAENNIKFTLLSPQQAVKIRKVGSHDWSEANERIETKRAYLCFLPSGKTVNIFFFDKATASDMAFGNLLDNGETFAKRLTGNFKDQKENQLENVASDGELYGHHHPFGDMTLAYCLYYITSHNLAKITNYGEFLEKNAPQFEVQIKENTSWSCIHGVERWRSDCGCNMGKKGWKQTWRKPLREAMDWLRNTLANNFEFETRELLKDPWRARDEYIKVILNRSAENIDAFLGEHAKKQLNETEKRNIIKLLEAQRHAMLMFTSCGWFFDEISGIESVQVMMYAARAMQLDREVSGSELEGQFIKILKNAHSNITEFENGGKIYEIFIKPSVVDFAKISAQNTILSLFSDSPKIENGIPQASKGGFKISINNLERRDDGKFRLITNRSTVYSAITLDQETFSCAAVWLGDHNVSCGALNNMSDKTFTAMQNEAFAHFEKGQINEIIVGLAKYFGKNNYSLKDMFRDDQKTILDYIVADGLKKAKELFDIVYHDNSALLRFMKENRLPSPRPLRAASEIILNSEIINALSKETVDLEGLQRLFDTTDSLAVQLDLEYLCFRAGQRIDMEFVRLLNDPENLELIKQIEGLLNIIGKLPCPMNLWQSQNIAFKIAENRYKAMKETNTDAAWNWVNSFKHLCELIGVRLE
jgi:alpha-amylase/alpha-mannosidase (GH57 family)